MRIRNLGRGLATGAVVAMLFAQPALAGLSGPGCMPNNNSFGYVLADFNAATPSYRCSLGGQQGNFGTTGYANGLFEYGGLNTAYPCTSISSRFTYGIGGTLYNGSRVYQTTIGSWSSSTAPSGRGIFQGVYWTTRPGIYDYSTTILVQGFNC
jgi:hypothetical protein